MTNFPKSPPQHESNPSIDDMLALNDASKASFAHVVLINQIGVALKNIRVSAGLSQAKMGGLLGISQSRIAQIESGSPEQAPSLWHIAMYGYVANQKPELRFAPPMLRRAAKVVEQRAKTREGIMQIHGARESRLQGMVSIEQLSFTLRVPKNVLLVTLKKQDRSVNPSSITFPAARTLAASYGFKLSPDIWKNMTAGGDPKTAPGRSVPEQPSNDQLAKSSGSVGLNTHLLKPHSID